MSRLAGRRVVVAVALTAVVAVGLTACGRSSNGEESKPAGQVLNDAKAAMSGVGRFHVAGRFSSSTLSIAIDLAYSPTRVGGTVVYEGSTLQTVITQDSVYLKADRASWQTLTGDPAQAAGLAGKWIKGSKSGPQFSDLASLGSEKALLDSISPEGSLTRRSGTSTYAGQSVVVLADATGSTVEVAASGPPYILRITNSSRSQIAGSATFDHFGDGAVPPLPRPAVDLTAETGPGGQATATSAQLSRALAAPPSGWAPAGGSQVHNGPVPLAEFDSRSGRPPSDNSLGYVAGYDVTFDRASSNDSVEIVLYQFDTAGHARAFEPTVVDEAASSFSDEAPSRSPIAALPGGLALDPTKAANDGFYDHLVVAASGARLMIFQFTTDRSGPLPPDVSAWARQQFSAL